MQPSPYGQAHYAQQQVCMYVCMYKYVYVFIAITTTPSYAFIYIYIYIYIVYAWTQPQYAPPVQAAPAPKPAASWTEHTADGGHKYWYNAATGVSTWERPAGF